jgi:hypothetical protein
MDTMKISKRFLNLIIFSQILFISILLAGCSQPVSDAPIEQTEPIFGIEDNRVDILQGAKYFQQLNAYWWRRNGVLWSEIETNESERNWQAMASLEQEIQVASESGLQPILVIRSTPSWAQENPGYSCGPIIPEKLPAFANFMHDLVKRYSAPPFNVKYWEIWNEPDVDPALVPPTSQFGCWGDPADKNFGGGKYANMLKAIYPAIKAADPNAQLIIGGLLLDCNPLDPPEDPLGSGQKKDCRPATYLQGILLNGGGDFFDGVSFHAYDYYFGDGRYGNPGWNDPIEQRGPISLLKSQYLYSTLRNAGSENKFLVNSEQAILCGISGEEEVCKSQDFLDLKAAYLAQAYTIALAQRFKANVWYSLTGWRASGLVTEDFQPQASHITYQFLSQLFRDTTFSKEISQPPEFTGYEFSKGGSTLWILWSTDGTTKQFDLPGCPSQIQNQFGLSLPLSSVIEITQNPVFIVWENS